MNVDAIGAVFVAVFLAVFLLGHRKKIEVQKVLFPLLYVVLYRDSFGLKSMDGLAKRFPRVLKFVGDVGVVLGFIGMVLIAIQLVWSTVQLFVHPGEVAAIQPVLPIQAKGVFFVPFLYWIISVFSLAAVHEFAHGVLARVHNIRVKNSGFAFLCAFIPIIPAAFVEPDESVLKKKSARQQLAVFAAGPFSNLIFAGVMILIFMVFAPVLSSAFHVTGVELAHVENDSVGFAAGLREGMVVTAINGSAVDSVEVIGAFLNKTVPGDSVVLDTQNGSFSVVLGENPKNVSRSYLGVQVRAHAEENPAFVARYGEIVPELLRWFAGLFFWLFMLNVGIGLFNLLPIGPLDGGRMFQLVCLKLFKKEAAMRVWSLVTVFFVVLILGNLIFGFVH